jgi:hypothetical protein
MSASKEVGELINHLAIKVTAVLDAQLFDGFF